MQTTNPVATFNLTLPQTKACCEQQQFKFALQTARVYNAAVKPLRRAPSIYKLACWVGVAKTLAHSHLI